MRSSICNQECNQGNCPFMSDPYNINRQVCVKCGKDYYFRRMSFGDFVLVFALIACIFLITHRPETSKSQSDKRPAIENTK